MKRFSFYHCETGVVHPQRYSTDAGPPRLQALLAANTPADHLAIEGMLDHLSQRVEVATGSVVDYQPPAPSAGHEWNAATKRWQLNAATTARQSRQEAARARIHVLEQSQHSAVRDALLGRGTEALAAIDAEILELKKQL